MKNKKITGLFLNNDKISEGKKISKGKGSFDWQKQEAEEFRRRCYTRCACQCSWLRSTLNCGTRTKTSIPRLARWPLILSCSLENVPIRGSTGSANPPPPLLIDRSKGKRWIGFLRSAPHSPPFIASLQSIPRAAYS